MEKEEIIKEFEEIGMIKALKEAQDFDRLQYGLMLRIFQEFLSLKLQAQKEEIIKMIEEYEVKKAPLCEQNVLLKIIKEKINQYK